MMKVAKRTTTIFQNLFSKKGRICRTEFWFKCILYCGLISLFFVTIESPSGVGYKPVEIAFILFVLVPCLGFLCGQAAKRCHDLGKSSLCLVNPYNCMLLFYRKGEQGSNNYGDDPRAIRSQLEFLADEILDDVFSDINKKHTSVN